jgi:hypothetical protein
VRHPFEFENLNPGIRTVLSLLINPYNYFLGISRDTYIFQTMSSTASSRTSAAFDTPESDASNVPPPGQSASPVTAGTTIDVPVTGDAENLTDNYDLDAEGGDDYTLCQKMVHYCGGHIVTEHLPACKAVLVFHAGYAICKLSSITKVVKEAAMLEIYNASIAALDEIHFGDSARFFEIFTKER